MVKASVKLYPSTCFIVETVLRSSALVSSSKVVYSSISCSSLTEMFAPQIHKDRLATWPTHYPWIAPEGLAYFRSRIPLASRDVEHGLRVTLDHFTTVTQQQRALDDVLHGCHKMSSH